MSAGPVHGPAEGHAKEGGAGPPPADVPRKPLPPWQETALARYPRKVKIGAVAVILLFVIAPFFIRLPTFVRKHDAAPIEAADNRKAKTDTAAGDETGSSIALNQPSNGVINNQDDHNIKLADAPDPGLTEDTADGSLPRIGEDGRQPWQIYARPFDTADQRPRIAIVVTDLGLSRVATDAAINRLPTNVTLAFDVQSPVVGAWCTRARQEGHEILLMIPMEPFDYPRSDPGGNTLLSTLPNADNLSRLNASLRQAAGYVGVTTLSGSRLTTDPEKLQPVLEALNKRGLMFFDARVAPHSAVMDMARTLHVAAAASTERLDQNPSPEAIDQALAQLEKTARQTGHAVGIASPLPVMIDRLEAWTKTLPERGIALAPITAMVQ